MHLTCRLNVGYLINQENTKTTYCTWMNYNNITSSKLSLLKNKTINGFIFLKICQFLNEFMNYEFEQYLVFFLLVFIN